MEFKAALPNVPVVVMSGSCPVTDDIDAWRDRADAYLTKPTDPAEYLEIVSSLD